MDEFKDDFELMLNDCYAQVDICGKKFDAGTAYRNLDPAGFNQAYLKYVHAMEEDALEEA